MTEKTRNEVNELQWKAIHGWITSVGALSKLMPFICISVARQGATGGILPGVKLCFFVVMHGMTRNLDCRIRKRIGGKNDTDSNSHKGYREAVSGSLSLSSVVSL